MPDPIDRLVEAASAHRLGPEGWEDSPHRFAAPGSDAVVQLRRARAWVRQQGRSATVTQSRDVHAWCRICNREVGPVSVGAFTLALYLEGVAVRRHGLRAFCNLWRP